MRFDAIYLIQGKPELHAHVAKAVDIDFADYLCERICISSEEGGRTDWSNEDHTLKIKLVFLASLGELEPLGTEKAFEIVFGKAMRDEDFFDRWWSIERSAIEWKADDMAEQFASEFDRMPLCSNRLVRDWLQHYRKQREPGAACAL